MKTVGRNLYLHALAIDSLLGPLKKRVICSFSLLDSDCRDAFNVIKISGERSVSFLDYPGFFDSPFPVLVRSWVVNPDGGEVRFIDYRANNNPPILHRKELLLPSGHPRQAEYSTLTAMAEAEGLFSDTKRIGYLKHWNALLKERGLRLVGHTLVSDSDAPLVERHRTALTRYQLSLPCQVLLEHGFLNGEYGFFDYGCGKGSDVKLLTELSVAASGWDPHFSPDKEKADTDIVNLGYVINVIEDPQERIQALISSGALAKKLLVVSAMIDTGKDKWARRYGDGGLTTKNTFQKYFSQDELRNYIESTLDRPALAVRPGIFFVFFDDEEEQQFLERRQRRRKRSNVLSSPRIDKDKLLETHGIELDELWSECLEYGRIPKQEELPKFSGLFSTIGSYRKTMGFLKSTRNEPELESAAESRRNDLRVYLALNEFYMRKSSSALSPRMATDIKSFFGSKKMARNSGQELLHQIAEANVIQEASVKASASGIGYLEEGKGLWLHSSNIEQLSSVLRVYIGAGIGMYGGIESFDLIKIHIKTGKLTLMVCDDFLNSPLPRMLERIKINMSSQRIDSFDYGNEYTPPYVFFKSRYLTSDQPSYENQRAFDQEMISLGIGDYGAYGPKPEVFDELLNSYGLTIDGYSLVLDSEFPGLDDPCGSNYTFRDFIECGETQARTGIENIPVERESYEALAKLARTVIDPIIDYFGAIELTYGFSGPKLSKTIKKGIAPKLDQHAAHELNRNGNCISPRLGAAVDFIVQDEDMQEVAQWIAENTEFDRLYYYGKALPVHISAGPDNKKEIIIIEGKVTKQGDVRRVPKTVSADKFKSVEF